MNTRITVYCGAAKGNDERYVELAEETGRWIASTGRELVYGGGGVGLMGIVAESTLSNGGQAYGIMPRMLVERGANFEGLTHMEVVDDMDVRKKRMMELGDALIAIPGGPGTLEEMAEAFSWARLGLNNKPSIFFNLDGYWDPIRDMFDRMVAKGFLTQEDRDKLYFTDSFEEIDRLIASYTPPSIRTYPDARA
ncbi:cytokinin riboside 5'-monophosphate phosphoribohydrolase [Bombiscardovia apis]|uniref:Cytokinin riboside 5'-monophosphate phosphoribohydrolase n=1 Tax=Bombiscardovia apis TaxID=2932182 RepID=A0ABN6SJE8_9BIFI|nr:TIGR00730 family Rossman fold protein [Bombiscardovia apis]BDR55071.1 cytokinin riboside 5'-monophosphate phosphoribohydrolase [Bombiscardovia apis]